MAIDIKVPAAGESITSANIAKWYKRNGDSVKKGEPLVSLETDKVSNELEAEADGILSITVEEGVEVAIGTIIGKLETTGEAPPQAAPASTPEPAVDSKDPVEIKVPAAGESITSANVAAWRKKDGEYVEKGETLVTLDTDKVSNELEAPVSGTIQILTPEGEEVAIGKVIATITPGSGAAASPSPQPASSPVAAPAETPAKNEAPAPAASSQTSRQKPDLSVLASAPEEKAQAATSSEGRTTRKKMSMLRRKIATHLVNAQQTAAILTTFNEVDMSAVMELRKSIQEEFVKKHGVKLGFMSFFVKAVTQALKDVPSINGRIDGTDVIENHFYDIGVAIGTDKGLIVPVLRDCDQKSFARIEQDILDYAAKGKSGKISIEDLQGGVFTISNGGVYGSLLSTPILNPPQSGILGMHTIQQRPVALNGQVVIRPMMYLALSYDHRLVDGKEAVTFLIRIKDYLEAPHRLLLEV
ncbi:dihydrolipoyllysine-residue succinyltransferase [Luteolibacter algae]|uniref:Dihydrolipoyllysine-residue succinyltransferase n=1 Tax=Luteolibacter algae TaxID=454151 RepID=A0ABW5D741_9BACT